MVVYIMGWLLAGYLFAHQLLSVWRKPESALLYLMQPASTLEKWLLMASTLLLGFTLLYSAVFAAVFSVASELGHHLNVLTCQTQSYCELSSIKPAVTFVPLRPHPMVLNVMGWHAQAAWALVYVALTGYAAAGLVMFKHHAALRTLVLAIGLCIALFLVLIPVGGEVNFKVLGVWLQPAELRVWASWAAYTLSLTCWLGVPALFWLASYRALREKDVA